MWLFCYFLSHCCKTLSFLIFTCLFFSFMFAILSLCKFICDSLFCNSIGRQTHISIRVYAIYSIWNFFVLKAVWLMLPKSISKSIFWCSKLSFYIALLVYIYWRWHLYIWNRIECYFSWLLNSFIIVWFCMILQ